MREVIAKSNIQPILTEGRSKIETETEEIIQGILDEYKVVFKLLKFKLKKLIHLIKLLMHLEMYRLQEQTWKDQKMKLKLMQMM